MTKEERAAYKKGWYERNKERLTEKNKIKYAAHREENLKQSHVYYLEHREELLEYQKEYKRLHPERIQAYQQATKEHRKKAAHDWHASHRDEVNSRHKIYMEEHKEEQRIKSNAHKQQKRKDDPQFKFTSYLRSNTSMFLRGKKRSARNAELLGCSYEAGKAHIESLFLPEMTWDRYGVGGFHIDHIIPCFYFDLANPLHQRVAFNYRNLQPLWELDNLRKNTNLEDGWQSKLYEICFALQIGVKDILAGSKFPV